MSVCHSKYCNILTHQIQYILISKLGSLTLLCRIFQRQNLQKFNLDFDGTFVTILHSVTGDVVASLNFHICFDSLCYFCIWGVWSLGTKTFFKGCFCNSKVKLFLSFVGFFTSAQHAISGIRHLFCSGQVALDLQLQPFFVTIFLFVF